MDDFLAKWASGDISEEEKEKFRQSKDYDLYKSILEGTEFLDLPDYNKDQSFTKVQEKIAKVPKVISLIPKWLYFAAASIALLIGFNVFFKASTTHTSGYGEQVSFSLPDDSEVILNANSSITYSTNSWQDERSLALNGEAYFKVNKGSTFTVKTANGEVSVLGTQFSVNANKTTFEVQCFEGKVHAKKGELSKVISKGQAVRAHNNNFEHWKLNQNSPSWLGDESTFDNVPLQQVILALENQYHIDIISDHINSDIRFTGFFTHSNLEIALKTVFETLEIEYTFKNEETLVLLTNNK